jgi:uncharacterized protein YdhG (YjbR/CyaY superfamily)
MATTQKTTKTAKAGDGFSAEERAAMRDRAKELKAADSRAEGERANRESIEEMAEPDRSLAERIHAIVTANGPGLVPRTYYGMPAYAKDGKVICFFQAAAKFKVRYATFGFQPDAALDDGTMWPTSFAVTALTAADEARIAELVRKAVG